MSDCRRIREQTLEEVTRKTMSPMSIDVILPFLRPIAHLLIDPAITEVMVNGSGRIFVEREGRLEAANLVRFEARRRRYDAATDTYDLEGSRC